MTEISTELRNRLVTARQRDGRCIYDRHVKRELVQECMKPGVSVSRMAMLYGVNANLLREWIDRAALLESSGGPARLPRTSTALTPAFMQVQAAKHQAQPDITVGSVRMQARLPNGVGLEFGAGAPKKPPQKYRPRRLDRSHQLQVQADRSRVHR